MTTRHLVDPELAATIEQLPVFNFTPATLPHIRAEQKEMTAQQAAALSPTPDIEVSEKFVPGPKDAPDVRVLVYVPKHVARPLAALLWIHGGGYVIGSADGDDADVKGIVQRAQATLPSASGSDCCALLPDQLRAWDSLWGWALTLVAGAWSGVLAYLQWRR